MRSAFMLAGCFWAFVTVVELFELRRVWSNPVFRRDLLIDCSLTLFVMTLCFIFARLW